MLDAFKTMMKFLLIFFIAVVSIVLAAEEIENQCLNGGTYDHHLCICMNGWTGKDCSVNIDDCAGAPCHHGSTCVDAVGTFFCHCVPGKTGLLCQLNDGCSSNPCHIDAICDTNPWNGSYTCSCASGYKGIDCTEDVDECDHELLLCEHNGICINTPGSFICDCKQGFTGPRCETNVNECESVPCLNGGSCLDMINGFKCFCPIGFEGISCETQINRCEPNPCQSEGHCENLIDDGYRCRCKSGTFGDNCEINATECDSNPCQNGAICINGINNSYTCKCASDSFTGTHCELNKLMDVKYKHNQYNRVDNKFSTNRKYTAFVPLMIMIMAFILLAILIVIKYKRACGQIWRPDGFFTTLRRRRGTRGTRSGNDSLENGQEMQNLNVNSSSSSSSISSYRMTPLMVVASQGVGIELVTDDVTEGEHKMAQMILQLLAQDAELVNATVNETGETALHLSARYARTDVAKCLLDAGFDVNYQDHTGRTPLHTAIAADALGVFQILLHDRITNLNSKMYDGTTPLILATRLSIDGMVNDLITADADIDAVDNSKRTALHWAAAVNNMDAINILLMHRANRDAKNDNDETPLFLAAREGSLEACKALLNNSANHEITDNMNRSPHDIAVERQHNDIVCLLDEHVACDLPKEATIEKISTVTTTTRKKQNAQTIVSDGAFSVDDSSVTSLPNPYDTASLHSNALTSNHESVVSMMIAKQSPDYDDYDHVKNVVEHKYDYVMGGVPFDDVPIVNNTMDDQLLSCGDDSPQLPARSRPCLLTSSPTHMQATEYNAQLHVFSQMNHGHSLTSSPESPPYRWFNFLSHSDWSEEGHQLSSPTINNINYLANTNTDTDSNGQTNNEARVIYI